MKRRIVLFVASISLATTGAVFAAEPTGPPTNTKPHRVVVAGPQEDAIATRIQKELTALGFETIRVGALDGCARSAVVVAATDSDAVAAACSDGDQVGVWVADSNGLRLRDVVVAREEGDRARETTAVRAAEITRATIAMHDAEEEKSSPPRATSTARRPAPAQWDTYDHGGVSPIKPAAAVSRRAPAFVGAAGVSSLLGVDASVAAFSGQIEVGILRNVAAAARLEFPMESSTISNAANIQVAPAFAGVCPNFPLSAPTSFIIPRLGGGVGIAWVNALRPAGSNNEGRPTSEGKDTTASPAFFANAGLSMRIVGPLRMAVEGAFGTTTSRMVVRNEGNAIAYWGQPFGALSLRMELMFQ
jgi:hypothetical protein